MNKKSKQKNYKHGYHFNSTYWQNYRKNLPCISKMQFEILFGMILGDACIYKTSVDAHIKFEQGYKQKLFLDHLYSVFKKYCFAEKVYERKSKNRHGILFSKSFEFKTLSHPSFTVLYNLFYRTCLTEKRKKTISSGLILHHLTACGLAYWIMCDGSLQNDKKTMILHTQSFSENENSIMSNEFNSKFHLHTKVISHKKIYYVIQTSSKDAPLLYNFIQPFIIDSMKYKLPKLNERHSLNL